MILAEAAKGRIIPLQQMAMICHNDSERRTLLNLLQRITLFDVLKYYFRVTFRYNLTGINVC